MAAVPSGRNALGRGTTLSAVRRSLAAIANNINQAGNLLSPTAGGIVVDADGPTITFDMTVFTIHQVTITANRILAVANVSVGTNQRFRIKLTQDGAGSHTVTWWSGISWAGGSPPTLTTTANKSDWFGFITTGSGTYDGFVIGQNV